MKLGKNRSPWSPMIRDDALLVVFKGPVAWTGKRPETGPNRTDLDRTAVAVAPPFWMDEPPATGPVKPVATASRYSFKIPSKRT